MEKFHNKSGILTKKMKFERKMDDCQEKNCKDGKCIEDEEAMRFYGTLETQESAGGEADLQAFYDGCKKNPGHTQFVPVNDFNISHLPQGYHDKDLVELIKGLADLTVRIAVTITSTERPKFFPYINIPYPYYDKRGSDVMRLGTGMVYDVNNWTEEEIKKKNMGTCPCHRCQYSDTPSKVWGEIRMCTARQVVFDDLEARNTSCRIFYDRQDSPLVTLDCWTVSEADIDVDNCQLKFLTCDVDLLDKLCKMVDHCKDLFHNVNNKYKSSRDKDTLTFIVSHPHGSLKHVSVGHCIDQYTLSYHNTKITYTTCTCPGSSGAHVHSLGYCGWLYYDNHVHIGVNTDGTNFSGTGMD